MFGHEHHECFAPHSGRCDSGRLDGGMWFLVLWIVEEMPCVLRIPGIGLCVLKSIVLTVLMAATLSWLA